MYAMTTVTSGPGLTDFQLPYGIDIPRLVRFITFTSLNTPPNIYWQAWLENTFPRFTLRPTQSPAAQSTPQDTEEKAVSSALATDASVQRRTAAEKAHASPAGSNDKAPQAQEQPKLNIRNTIIKFLLDQTLGAAINTLLFIAGVDLLQGQSWAYIKADIATVSFHFCISPRLRPFPIHKSELQGTVRYKYKKPVRAGQKQPKRNTHTDTRVSFLKCRTSGR